MSEPTLGIMETLSQNLSQLLRLVESGLVIQGELVNRVSQLEDELKAMKEATKL